jgi:hypothetical protein
LASGIKRTTLAEGAVLQRIFGPRKEEAVVKYIMRYFIICISFQIKNMGWVEHLACMQAKGNVYTALVRKPGQKPVGKFGHR